jgi:protein-tyrosine phosphatase
MREHKTSPGRRRSRRVRRTVILCAIGIPLFVVGLGLCRQGLPVQATPPPADAEPGRWLLIDGAQNTRDVGGYATQDGRRVRRGVVYRSGTLSHVTVEGCEAFRDLGVATVIDFRNRLSPLPLFDGDVLCIHRAADVYGFAVSFRSEGPREQRYLQGLRENADSFRRAFELLAEPQRLPLLYHCAIGTDRTGVMTALLLRLLGVDRETVMADFRLSEQVGTPGNEEAMEALLDEIEASGGIEPFLVQLGVSRETQAAIRRHLLERP